MSPHDWNEPVNPALELMSIATSDAAARVAAITLSQIALVVTIAASLARAH